MKLADLTIGDWVRFPNDDILDKVICIDGLRNEIDGELCSHNYCNVADLQPIPLTADVLKKNGFRLYARYTGEDIWMEYNHNIEVVITNYASTIRVFTIDDIDDGYNLIYLQDVGRTRYVHELQHALRLVGLNELANNFKI